MKNKNWIAAAAAGLGVAAITYSLISEDIPDGAVAVEGFDMDRYLGTWFEIARLPSWIEKDLVNLTETYAADRYGHYTVVTKAFNTKTQKWKKFPGKIKFTGSPNVGMLKVSYLGPFYLSYNILAVDPDYQYALVSGSSLNYLWILSKQQSIPAEIKTQFLALAGAIGFDVQKLEWL